MKYIKSTEQKDIDFAEYICSKLNLFGFKAKRSGFFNSLCFVPGITITVKISFLTYAQFVCHNHNVILYTREDIINFPDYLNKIIKKIESIIKKDLIIKHSSESNFGGI